MLQDMRSLLFQQNVSFGNIIKIINLNQTITIYYMIFDLQSFKIQRNMPVKTVKEKERNKSQDKNIFAA